MELVNPTRYFSDLFYLTGSHKCALFLGQLLYWNDHKGKLGRIAKTAKEWETEIQLTVPDVTVCHKICLELGFIEIESRKFNNVTKTHYTVHKELILKCCSMIKTRSISESKKLRISIIESRKNLETSLKEIKSPASKKVRVLITETITETTTKTINLADEKSAQIKPPIQPDLFGEVIEKKATTKSPKEPKEKAPPAPPKHLHFTAFRDSYLNWYKAKFGVAHTFAAKEAGLLSTLIDRLKQVTEADEQTALLTFQAMLTNWDELGNYNRGKPQLNLLLANLNSIISELKEQNDAQTSGGYWNS